MNKRVTLFGIAAVSALFLLLVVAGAVFVFSPFGRGGLSHNGDPMPAVDPDADSQEPGREQAAQARQEPASEPPDDSLTVMLAGRDERLTDSMMLLHIDGGDEAARILTIPRDLWYGGRKINEKYYHGGGEAMMNAVGDLTGYQPEHYAVVDMEGFVEIIDHLGGIEITLEEPLHDHTLLMPDRQSRVDYEAGTHEVSGAEALLIARSRATSDDFERAQRQTRIIEGLQDRVSDISFSDIPALYGIARTIYDYVDTDMSVARAVGYLLDYGIIDDFERSGLTTDNVLENSHSAYLPDDEVAHRSGWPDDMEQLVRRRDPEEVESERRPFGGNKAARVIALARRDRDSLVDAWDEVRQQYLPEDEDPGTVPEGEEAGDAAADNDQKKDTGSSLFDPPPSAISFKRRAIDATGIYRTLPARGAWLLQPVDGDWEHVRWYAGQFFENGVPDDEPLRDRLGREPGENR